MIYLRKFYPYWPIILFLLLTLVFFWRVFLEDKVPIPADLIVGGYYPWLDYRWGTISGVAVKNPIQSDVVSVIYPIKLLAIDLIKNGEWPLWNWNMFAGYPLLANFQLGLFYPSMIFYFLTSTPLAWSIQVILQPLIALIGMYLFLRHLSLGKIASVFGAVIYGFGGFMMIWLEWNVLGVVVSYLPLLLLLEDLLIKRKEKRWGISLSLVVALEIFAGYPQMVVYSLLVGSFWLLFLTRSWKDFLLVGIFVTLGIGITSILLFPGFELFSLSQRRIEILGGEVPYLPWQYLVGFLAPDYFGNHATGNFWGYGNYTYMSIYSGLIGFIMAAVGVIQGFKDRKILFFGGLFLFTLALMLSTPLGVFFYNLGLWGGKAASATRAAFIVNFSVAVLGSFGIESLSRYHKKNPLAALMAFLLVGVITAITYLSKGSFGRSGMLEQAQNLSVALHNLILPLFLAITVLAVLYLHQFFPKKYPLFQIALIVLAVLELFRFGWKFNSFSPQSYLYPSTPITSFLSGHSDKRIIGGEVIPANMWIPFGLQSAAGYDAVYPLTWSKFLGVLNSGDPRGMATRFGLINNYDSKLLNLTSSNYILALKRKGEKVDPGGEIDDKFKKVNLKPVFVDKSVVVLQDTSAFPRAFLVNKVISVDKKQTYNIMLTASVPFDKMALVNDGFTLDSNLANGESPKLAYTQLANNHVQVSVNSPNGSFLVVLNDFYPGWQASIDNHLTDLHLTDGTFWGVNVPSGQHTVDFVYYPRFLILGIIISLVSLVVLLALAILPDKFIKYEKTK